MRESSGLLNDELPSLVNSSYFNYNSNDINKKFKNTLFREGNLIYNSKRFKEIKESIRTSRVGRNESQ